MNVARVMTALETTWSFGCLIAEMMEGIMFTKGSGSLEAKFRAKISADSKADCLLISNFSKQKIF